MWELRRGLDADSMRIMYLKFRVYFYGEHITPQEMNTAKGLIKANAVNFNVSNYEISFYKSLSQLCKEENYAN